MGKQQILKPNAAEEGWIRDNLLASQDLLRRFAPDVDSTTVFLRALDKAFAGWLAANLSTREDPNPGINAFGMAFGQYIVDQLQLSWVVVSDELGTELAVHGQPGNVLVFPLNFVAKRYTNRETGFFVNQGGEMMEDIKSFLHP